MKRILRGIKACALYLLITVFMASSILPVPAPAMAQSTTDGSILPFPPVPSASIANPTLQESTMTRREVPDYLPEDAPNILIIMIDDVGFGQTSAFGGEIYTPTLEKLRDEGIS